MYNIYESERKKLEKMLYKIKKTAIVWVMFLSSCVSTTMITGSWKSPSYYSKSYKSILVAALTNHVVAKSTVENDISKLLNKENIRVSKSIDLLPIKASNSDSSRTSILDKVRGKNIDAILTISLLKKETETHYTPGDYAYDPFRYDYYRSFWGYYSYWYPYTYSEGYYSENTVYYIETNLYDVKTEDLVWSAQSKTYDVLNLRTFSNEFANSIVTKLKKDKILKTEKNV